ncbi:hypothetical protein APU19_11160 [Klebsiella pneumoniae]|nr:hypothetical protein APU19_11160 [Klebsiella pneumoniae]
MTLPFSQNGDALTSRNSSDQPVEGELSCRGMRSVLMPYQTGSIITVQQAADQSPVKARENPGQPRTVSKGQNIYFLPRTVNIRAQTALPLVIIQVEIHQTFPKVTT